jgi:hypothetical protein
MGIGFVLFGFFVLGFFLAIIAGGIAAVVCRIAAKRRGRPYLRACLVAFAFPFACLIFCGMAFLGYAEFCGSVLNEDPGVGDWWQVPIGHGYTFVMVDTTEDGSIQSPWNEDLFGNVTGIAAKGDHAAFVQDFSKGTEVSPVGDVHFPAYSILDLQTGKATSYKVLGAFQAAAESLGIGPGDIVSPDVFYARRRWLVVDLIFPLLTVAAIGLGAALLVRRFRESLRDAPVLAMNRG